MNDYQLAAGSRISRPFGQSAHDLTSSVFRCGLGIALLCFSFLGVICPTAGSAELPPSFRWAQQAKAYGWTVWCEAITTDAPGCVYVAGSFKRNAEFGDVLLTNSPGSGGMFLTKYDRLGHLAWARQLGDQYMQVAPRGLAVDAATNIWMLGYLNWPSSGSIGGVMIRPASVFVAKCDHLGNLVWVRGIASGAVSPRDIAVDAAGNSYCGGSASETATLDGTPMGPGGWLLKLDGEGNQLWSRIIPGSAWKSRADTLAVDAQGEVFLGGRFDGTVVFGETNSLTAVGDSDLFFARFAPSGRLLWVNQVGGTNDAWIDWSGVDAAGNWYVEGQFQSSATFSGVVVGSGTTDWHTFVTKYDRDGHLQWVRVIFEQQQPTLFAVDAAGNSFVAMTGSTNGHVLQKLNPVGDLKWTKVIQFAFQSRLAADQVGNLYWGASFDSATYQLDSFTLTSSVRYSVDLALAKLDTTTPPQLGIEKSADEVRLSWSALAMDFYLEHATNVGSPFWQSNTAVPSVVGASNVVTLPSSDDRMFFRLKRQ